MKLAILILVIVMGLFAGFVYENYEKLKEKTAFSKKNSKHIIYFLISGLLMIGLALILQIKYSNRLIDNIRLIIMMLFLIPIALVDYRQKIIENKVILVGIVTRIIMFVIEIFIDKDYTIVYLKSVGLGFVLVIMMAIIGIFIVKNGFGMGDIKLMMLMVLYLGFSSSFASIFIALFLSMIVSIILLLKKEKVILMRYSLIHRESIL